MLLLLWPRTSGAVVVAATPDIVVAAKPWVSVVTAKPFANEVAS